MESMSNAAVLSTKRCSWGTLLLQAGMDCGPDEPPGPSQGGVVTETGLQISAEDEAALFDDSDGDEDEDDVDLDALEKQVAAS
jgi:hypothetical protein